MLSFIKSYKYQNGFIIILLLLQNLLLLASTLTTMRMARLVMDGDFEGIVACMIFVIIVYLTLHFLFWIYDVNTARTIARMNQDVRASLNRQIIERNAEELNKMDTGEYISWYTNDLKEAETQGFQNFYSAVDAVIKLIIGIVVLARIQWKLLICTLLTTGMVYVFSHHFHGNVEEESGKVSKAWETFTQVVKEQVGGVHVLKSFGHERDFKENIQAATGELESQRCRYVRIREKAALKMKGINALAGLVNNLVLFGMCAFRVIPAEIFFGGGNLTNQVKESILSLSEIRIAFAGAKPYFEKINRQIRMTEHGRVLPPIRDEIETRELGFSYPGHPVFANLNLRFKVGGKYAIVGKSGCGKTTLLKLLLGQLRNYDGTILFDKVEASSYDPKSFCGQIAYIEQNVFMFHTTIRENITLGQIFSEEALEEVLKKSALYEDMKLFPNGLDTDVGENGRNLSGGQRQRIAVARALLYNRNILIMDEGTSALDRENAKAIEEVLLKDPDITLILVSHHLDEDDMKNYTAVYRLGEKVPV